MRTRLVKFIAIIQGILFAAHGFVYATWTAFHPHSPGITALRAAVGLLSVSFVAASLVAFRSASFWAKCFYKVAAFWLGTLNFLFLAAMVSWAIFLGRWVLGSHARRPGLVAGLYALAIVTSLYGLINARRVRVRCLRVRLSNLPETWRGRTAALVSDLHLGHVNGRRFLRKVLARVEGLRPDAIFIAGDLFDGARADLGRLAAEWKRVSPALGTYFVTGNHEEFSDPAKYLDALRQAGVRVLNGARVRLDGLDLVGVPYGEAARPERLRAILQSAGLERGRPSILLTHAPRGLAIAEQAGIALQLSGHTHGGQIFPFTFVIQKVYGKHAYGLHRSGNLLTYTSSGCGTWGPPLRVGTRPEIVLIEFA